MAKPKIRETTVVLCSVTLLALFLWNRELHSPLFTMILARPHATNDSEFLVVVTNHTPHRYDLAFTSEGLREMYPADLNPHSIEIIGTPPPPNTGAQVLTIEYTRSESRLRQWANDLRKLFGYGPAPRSIDGSIRTELPP